MKNLTLVVCDVQPEVVKKVGDSSLFVDLVDVAIRAARNCRTTKAVRVVHTMLQFSDSSYESIPLSHPKLGILRKLKAKNSNIDWFTSPDLCIPSIENETVVSRTTFLPQATDTDLLEALRDLEIESLVENQEFVVLGYGPTVQAVCNLLGDVIGAPNVRILQECVRDENSQRCRAFLDHGLLFREEVASLVDFLESMDLLQERITDLPSSRKFQPPVVQKYVCDCERGGHLSLFMFYLIRDHGYVKWPRQPWFQDITKQGKQYWCPLGRRIVDLCNEPQFGSSTRFFLKGRKWLDEKDLLHSLVPELMPPTFQNLEDAQTYCDSIQKRDGCVDDLVWFLKKVDQNGGRAVQVCRGLPTSPIQSDEQLQVHVPRPLLFEISKIVNGEEILSSHKCHVKTYQWIGCTADDTTNEISWQMYMHGLYYLATADKPFDPSDLSDEVQISTMRRHRLYADHPWRVRWNLTQKCESKMETILRRAIERGKLRCEAPSLERQRATGGAALQFEIITADWMLDEDGNMFLIECNGTPVLYDPMISQPLTTRGLRLYDGLYKANPTEAVVNDTGILRDALWLALKGKLPKKTLWKHIATIPSP